MSVALASEDLTLRSTSSCRSLGVSGRDGVEDFSCCDITFDGEAELSAITLGLMTLLMMTFLFIADGDFDSLRLRVRDCDFSLRRNIVDSAGFFVVNSCLACELSLVRLCD